MLILEDDIELDRRIHSALKGAEQYPDEWNIVFVGYKVRGVLIPPSHYCLVHF